MLIEGDPITDLNRPSEHARHKRQRPSVAFRDRRLVTMRVFFGSAKRGAYIVGAIDDLGNLASNEPFGDRRHAGYEIRRITQTFVGKEAEEMVSPQPHQFVICHNVDQLAALRSRSRRRSADG